MSLYCCLGYVVLLVVIYKALDWLVRRLYLGEYANRYILVTGCDTGFGNILAKRLDAMGCHVFAGCLTEAGGAELQKACSTRVKVIPLNVSNAESVQRAFEMVKATLPAGKGLWGVMNNAGVFGPCGPPSWACIDDYKAVAAVNLYGLIDVTMTFLPLVKMACGRVVNTASVFGRISLSVCVPYGVTKFGVEAFTDGLRRALYPFRVKAVLIEPGIFKTNMGSYKALSALCEKSWKQAATEVRQEYGEEYFKYFSTAGVRKFDNIGSEPLTDVVDAYVHALLGRFPRARYVVGKDAKYLWLVLQWMPEWISDWLLFNFDPNQPLPAALSKKDQ